MGLRRSNSTDFFFGLATDFTEKEGVLVVYLSVC